MKGVTEMNAEKFFVDLPDYDEAQERFFDGCSTDIDNFIYENEPAGTDDVKFRTQLQLALDHAYALGMAASRTNVELQAISDRLKTQDNRSTANPMFCVQILVRDVGYDPAYASDTVWIDMESGDHQEVPPHTPGAEEFGWKERWETVMVAFTEGGCEEYLNLNGHNVKRKAYKGQVRIYVETWNRCPEMIAIREFMLAAGVVKRLPEKP